MSRSEAEAAYCTQSVQAGLRLDGRALTAYRPMEVEVGIIPQANGSARLRLGDTDVMVGIKAEVGTPSPDHPDSGRLQVTVECSPCASPEYEGRGGEAWGQQLAQALEASLAPGPSGRGGLPLQPLCIIPGKVAWVVHVDGLVLNDTGGVLGALSAATLAALAVTRLPRVTVSKGGSGAGGEGGADGEGADGEGGEDGGVPEIELEDDETGEGGLPLEGLHNVPLIVSVGQVGQQLVVDMSALEEQCARATLHVAVSSAGAVCGVTQEGKAGAGPVALAAMLEAAVSLGPQVQERLRGFLASPAAQAMMTGGR